MTWLIKLLIALATVYNSHILLYLLFKGFLKFADFAGDVVAGLVLMGLAFILMLLSIIKVIKLLRSYFSKYRTRAS